MSHTPSSQQANIYQWVTNGTGSALVIAVAGAGKTTTLVHACGLMKGSVAFAAYNKKIADEIGTRVRASGVTNVRSGTFHSFGFSAWRRVAPLVTVDGNKVQKILDCAKSQIDDSQLYPEEYHPFIKQVVSLAKQSGIGILTPFTNQLAWWRLVEHYELDDLLTQEAQALSEQDREHRVKKGLQMALDVLRISIDQDRTVIDFDDMLYAPLIHDVKMWQNDWVLVDEAQDTNPARRAIAKKMLRPGGRLLAVGDPAQAIYGFTGADNDSLQIIEREFNCTTLPLTVTYRCPKEVVQVAQQWVSHIEAAPTAPDGKVVAITDKEFTNILTGDLDKKKNFTPADVVLCRNTKPLVELAFLFVRKSIPCHVEGKDIGRGLMALAGKWKVKQLDTLLRKLDDYLQKETARFMSKGQEQKAEALSDRIETIKVICASLPAGSSVVDLQGAVDKLFGDVKDGEPAPNLTLSTIHKAKGREWDRVYLYGRNKYQPSPYARQMWQQQQETNLMYVAVTRAKQTLVEVVVS